MKWLIPFILIPMLVLWARYIYCVFNAPAKPKTKETPWATKAVNVARLKMSHAYKGEYTTV